MFHGLRNISVTNSPHVDLLVAETYSHHLHHKSRDDSDNDSNSDYTDSDEEPELRTRPDEFSGNEEEKINPLNVFLRIYQQCRIRQQQEANTLNINSNNNSSSSNNNKSSTSSKEFLEIGTKNAMVRALIDIHFHLNGISPLTTKRLGEPYLDVNVNSQMADLLDANHRMKLLTDLYLEIPTTFLKAKAAYALGLHAVDTGDLVLAEKFFFECLYIIDKCKQPVVGLPLVLSELSANASIGYAGVLLDNYKYQYAIVSFDNALLVYNIQSTSTTNLSGAANRNNPLRTSATPKASFHSSAGGSGNNKNERNLKYWEFNCINYLHANKFSEALICIECAIEICPASSLNARGQYFYLRGKIFQKLVSFSNATLITFPTTLKPTSEEWKEFVDVNQPTTTYTCTGDLMQEGIASFKRAYNYFKSIGDDVRIQKTVSRIAETYLDRVFGPVALLHYQFDDVARLPHFTPSRFIQKDGELYQDDKNKRNKKKEEPAKPPGSPPMVELKEFYISFEIIENPAILAMDINIDTCNVIQLLRNYMNMAELRYLQGDRDLAISYWTECRNLYFTMFCDGPHLIGKSAPLFFLKKLFSTCKRMIRFLFAFDQDFINKNLMLVDSYLSLEIDISQAKKRNIELNKPLSYESNPQISKIYMPYLGKSYTLGRNFKRKTEMTGALSMDNIPTPNHNNGSNSTGADGENKLSTLTFNEKTKDEEKSVNTGDEVGEKIWGSLHAISNEIRKYSIGKITQEELCTRSKVTIKQILKIQLSYKNHLANQHAGSPTNYPVPLQSSNSLGSLFRSQTKMNLNAIANGNTSSTTDSGRTRTPSNAGANSGSSSGNANNWGTVRNLSSKYEELSFSAAQAKINASLQKLVYSLQVDNYFIHYVPHTGRKRFNRIGGLEELTPMPPPTNMLYLEIYLLSNANEKVSFVVSPLITLEKLLLFLCNKPYWAVDSSDSKKKSFFGSFSRAANNSFKSTPKFIEKTPNFHNELISFLNSTIGVPGTDEDTHSSGSDSPPQERAADKQDHHHHPHTPTLHSTSPPIHINNHHQHAVHHQHINTQPNLPTINITHANQQQHNQDIHGRSMSVGSSTPRKVYSHQQLSLISFTKRMIKSDDPAYAKAYVSFDQLSYQICKVFSHREMRECSEQNPLQLSLFVNNGEEKKSQTNLDQQTTSKSAPTNDQAITFTPEILSSFLPLLSLVPSKDSIQEEVDRKKIITELKHTTFSSLFEILPTEKPDSNSIKPSASSSSKKQSKTFVFFGSNKDATTSTMPTTNISTTPLIFICSKSLQVFPWELIIPDFMVRYLTLYDLMRTNYIDISDPENQENGIIPCFISCCNSVIDKSHYNDPVKKDQQVKSILYNLYTTINKTTTRVSNENQPYLSPLIKLGVKPAVAKKKYKYLDFFDVATNKTSGVVHFLESFDDSIHFPVFIFAYNDIVDLSQLPIFILRSKPICNVLFIPYSKQKEIMSRLFKIYDAHLKQNIKNSNPPTRKERYQFFISSVQSLKEEFYIPIALFNPTFIVNNQ
ncbi:hypothetical protein PPL_00425 [Heterostelium album PN500]|uniref:Uncharacterized protein n=1 Tax=Heterostelium pallidum (strain ATCC 26659 / Pp 5 / PN500) TaxID=670386 RepID=D3AWF1_HETP5|nr:hypothetical protein PPL_00425 [Heterostelium album PN500]EFA86624.1 hypothetical protein PPL_00425 [Heterostelium album PN500]|eukprot:XP_020438729.1 hypothetical protein PPL_00425 [Heterostelium album PN500]